MCVYSVKSILLTAQCVLHLCDSADTSHFESQREAHAKSKLLTLQSLTTQRRCPTGAKQLQSQHTHTHIQP